MKFRLRKSGLVVLVVVSMILMAGIQVYAHKHGEFERYSEKGYAQAGREDHGGEATGVIAAWLFGIANFPVALSILLKAGGKAIPRTSTLKKGIAQANSRQKRYLMRLHYWLNPIAAAVAILHFASAECRSTFIPELGLGMMLLIIVIGLMMTFRMSPAPVRRAFFKVHTSPVSLVAAISILMIGHSLIR